MLKRNSTKNDQLTNASHRNPYGKSIAVALLLILSAPLVVAHSELTGQRSEPQQFEYEEWVVNTAAMRHAIARGEPVEVHLGDMGKVPAILEEVNFFGGTPTVNVLADNFTVQEIIPVHLWAFRGHVVGEQDSRITITMDASGMVGTVRAFDSVYHYESKDPSELDILQEPKSIMVRWEEKSLEEPPTSVPIQALAGPGTGGGTGGTVEVKEPNAPNSDGGGSSSTTYEHATVSVYADLRYRNAHADWATRITNAFNEQESMWLRQVNINIGGLIISSAPNFSDKTDCWYYDQYNNIQGHLEDFRSKRTQQSGVDAYQLFTGIKFDSSYGCAHQGPVGSSMSPTGQRSSVVVAYDHSIWDKYDPDESDDLGLFSGHEIAHNWGTDHDYVQDSQGVWNIMASGKDPDKRDFWFSMSGKSDIKAATAGNM